MRPRHLFLAPRVVDEDEYRVGVVITEIGVGVVAREEVHRAAVVDHGLRLAPLEEPLRVVEEPRLYGIALRRVEQVHRVALPAAGEIHAQPAVSLREVFRGEHHLVAREYLRDAAHRGQHRHREFQPVGVSAYDVADAVGVVVGDEDHHFRQVMVDEIVRQAVVDARHALAPAERVGGQRPADGLLQREIHDRRQVRVEAVLVGIAALPVCQLRDRRRPAFAHDVEIGVFPAYGRAPLAHRHLLVVGVGVDAEPVQAGILDPPHGPLLEILQHIGIVEVHVGHRRHEPAALLQVEVVARSVGIHVRREADVRPGVFGELVYPVPERQVFHPPVARAAVVGDDVHNHLQPVLVGFADELPIQFVRAEPGVYAVVVAAGVAVVRTFGFVVQQQRRGPYGRGAQPCDVIQVVDHPLQVAPVAAEEGAAVGALPRVGRRVVRRIAVGEAVGHQEVDHVGRGETLACGRAFGACRDLIGNLELPFPLREYEVVGARFRVGFHLHVHE